MSGVQGAKITVAAVLLLCAVTPVATTPAYELTIEDVNAAIAFGLSGDPGPYPLRHWERPNRISDVLVGAIYTPFVRVALAARDLRAKGITPTADGIPREAKTPTVYIAFRWYESNSEAAVQGWLGSPYMIADKLTYKRPFPAGQEVRLPEPPLWVDTTLATLSDFGGPPFADTVSVAAYPIGTLLALPNFVVFREFTEPGAQRVRTATEVRVGRILPEELAGWR